MIDNRCPAHSGAGRHLWSRCTRRRHHAGMHTIGLPAEQDPYLMQMVPGRIPTPDEVTEHGIRHGTPLTYVMGRWNNPDFKVGDQVEVTCGDAEAWADKPGRVTYVGWDELRNKGRGGLAIGVQFVPGRGSVYMSPDELWKIA